MNDALSQLSLPENTDPESLIVYYYDFRPDAYANLQNKPYSTLPRPVVNQTNIGHSNHNRPTWLSYLAISTLTAIIFVFLLWAIGPSIFFSNQATTVTGENIENQVRITSTSMAVVFDSAATPTLTTTPVLPSPTHSSTPTPPPPSPTFTSTLEPPTSTPLPTTTPTTTGTSTPTETPLPPTTTPTPTATATTAELAPLSAPVLLGPQESAVFGPQDQIRLEWTSIKVLADDERYAIRILFNPKSDPAQTWPAWQCLQETSYTLSVNDRNIGWLLQESSNGTFPWRVILVKGLSEEDCQKISDPIPEVYRLSQFSASRTFTWRDSNSSSNSGEGTNESSSLPASPDR
ncbi:MAG: hypothetical protein AAF629_29295 [Chloroflexota bacterium]